MLSSFQVRDHVVGIHFFVQVRAQHQPEPDQPLGGESDNEVGVFCRNRRCRYVRGIFIIGRTNMDDADVSASHRTHEYGRGACLRCREPSAIAQANCPVVSVEGKARLRHAPVEALIEENDLAGYLIARQGGEFGKTAYDENFSRDPIPGSSDAQTSQRSYHYVLGRPRYLAGILNEFAML